MFVIGNFVAASAKILELVINILSVLIFFRALISWVNPDPFNFIVQLLHKTTEPVLAPIRRRLPLTMGIDISPFIAILALLFLRWFVVGSLLDLAVRLS